LIFSFHFNYLKWDTALAPSVLQVSFPASTFQVFSLAPLRDQLKALALKPQKSYRVAFVFKVGFCLIARKCLRLLRRALRGNSSQGFVTCFRTLD